MQIYSNNLAGFVEDVVSLVFHDFFGIHIACGARGRWRYAALGFHTLDGSKLSGAQVAVAPSAPGNLAFQLVKGNPATGSGAMTGVTYIQRVETKGGVAPATPCTAGNVDAKEIVKYQADYIFYKAS